MDKQTFLQQLLQADNPLIFDGAMGTMLHSMGESFEGCLDELNISNPAAGGGGPPRLHRSRRAGDHHQYIRR